MVDFYLAHTNATVAAAEAAKEYANQHFDGNDGGACGFAWVSAYPKHKGNTKLGRLERSYFEQLGFRKNYTGKVWELWNPSSWNGQSVDVKMAGARAYVNAMKEAGVDWSLSAGDRLD